MLTWDEILKGNKEEDIPEEHLENLKELLEKMNKVRSLYGKPMTVTNAYRTLAHHLQVYADKGITDQSKIPMKSKHLFGFAVDIADASGDLNEWCKDHEDDLREIGIWLENRQGNWQHFQIRPFGSYKNDGTIFFNP